MEDLKDRVVLVTGAAGGLGQATVAAFLQAGAKVALSDINLGSLNKAQENFADYQSRVLCVEQNVANPESWDSVIDKIASTLGPLNVLVNNAAISPHNNIETTSYDDWKSVLAVNLDGTFLGTKHAIAHMKQHQGGVIVNLSSMGARAPSADSFSYCTSKAGVDMVTKAAANHCASSGYGIRINSIQPGPIRTPMLQALQDNPVSAPLIEQMIANIPMGRLAEPGEIAQTILFLASDASSYMTGAEIIVDGGYITS